MSPLKTEAERTPHAQCRDACTGPHRWFNTGDGMGGLKYWCEGPRPANEPTKAFEIPLQTFLQNLIRASGVPQKDLAQRAGLTEKHVSEMMNGWSQGKLSAWQALLDGAGVALPAVPQGANR